jgi:DNA-binding NarL/FixJ family response regulator
MLRRKVLVLIKQHFLNVGVQGVLSRQKDLQVLAKAISSDTEMMQVVDTFRPDTIVVDEGFRQQRAQALAACFEAFPALRTVIVNWEDNTIRICDKETIVIKELEEFVAAVWPSGGKRDPDEAKY